jgi:hypothetical protein
MFRRGRLTNLALLLVAIASAGRAESSLVPNRLALDALVWASVHWWRWERAGLANSEFVFERVAAPVGLTGRPSSLVSLRVSGDVSVLQPLDLYADLHWSNGIGLRAGQLLLPLGMDAMTEPGRQRIVGSSFLVGHTKPAGSRDIGVVGTWERGGFSGAAAVVSGAGANAGDNNDRKDLCGRIAVRPLRELGLTLAVHGYYGRPDLVQRTWQTLGAEASIERGRFYAQTEFQDQRYSDTRSDDGYALVSYSTGPIESCVRIESVILNGQKPDLTVTGGVNLRPVGDNAKVMINCFYRRDYQFNLTVSGFVLRLQIEL